LLSIFWRCFLKRVKIRSRSGGVIASQKFSDGSVAEFSTVTESELASRLVVNLSAPLQVGVFSVPGAGVGVFCNRCGVIGGSFAADRKGLGLAGDFAEEHVSRLHAG
jgi:hypothetical protein